MGDLRSNKLFPSSSLSSSSSFLRVIILLAFEFLNGGDVSNVLSPPNNENALINFTGDEMFGGAGGNEVEDEPLAFGATM